MSLPFLSLILGVRCASLHLMPVQGCSPPGYQNPNFLEMRFFSLDVQNGFLSILTPKGLHIFLTHVCTEPGDNFKMGFKSIMRTRGLIEEARVYV